MPNQLKALQSATTCIDEYVKTLQKRIQTAQTYGKEQRIAIEFITQFPESAGPEPDADGYIPYSSSRTTVGFTLDAGTIQCLMINYQADNLADLVEPLRWLTQQLGLYTIEDDPNLSRRAYIFNDGRLRFQVFFGGLLGLSTSVCKFIQVGVKEEPVYELRCE